MTRPLVVRPEALSDLLDTRDWYNERRSGLGEQFVSAAEELLEHVRARPELCAVVYKGTRRAKLRRFPYIVYYRVLDTRTEVLAVLHASRDSRVWKRRTRSG